jgi:peptidoglycan/xylan/chitin deacetylase (PgdA/CDA1 family)
MYHHISPLKGEMITVTPSDFEGHLRSIVDGGYRTLSLKELLAFIEGSLKIDGRALVLTFDDAYLDNYIYAFPLIKKYGVRAVIFAPTAWLDGASASPLDSAGLRAFRADPPTHNQAKALIAEGKFSSVAMDWEMARTMKESGLVEFGSHTETHAECDALDEARLERELQGSRARLEEELGAPCDSLCWPRGRFNEAAIEAARKAGYRACFTTRRGVVSEKTDPMRIERIVTKEGESWVSKRLAIYTSPLLSRLYIGMRGKKG